MVRSPPGQGAVHQARLLAMSPAKDSAGGESCSSSPAGTAVSVMTAASTQSRQRPVPSTPSWLVEAEELIRDEENELQPAEQGKTITAANTAVRNVQARWQSALP
eukprot:628698-Prymnesium_polylepis.1